MTREPKHNVDNAEGHLDVPVKRFLEFLAANGGGFASMEGDGFAPFDDEVIRYAEQAKLVVYTKKKKNDWYACRMTKAGYVHLGLKPPSRFLSFFKSRKIT